MKKFSLLFIVFLMAMTFTFAQTDVVVTIDVNNNPDVTSVMFKGTPSGWNNIPGYDDGTNGDATPGDNIWSATFNVACDGTTHEWGAVDQNDGWLLEGPNPAFTVDASCNVTGQSDYVIPGTGGQVDVTLTVTDPNMDIGGIQIKGSYGGWASEMAYDDGTNGDATAGDGIWTLQVTADIPATGDGPKDYEWGAERTDCASPAWIIQGPNRLFTVGEDGSVSGDTNYGVPAAGTSYNVTFRVYMGNEIVSADGLYVSGEFETCPWSKQDIQLTEDPADPGVYTATYAIEPGVYSWKYFNGFPGLDDGGENQGGTPFATVFQDEGCGVDNGFGGSNRQTDFSAMTADMMTPIYVFNSCNVHFGVNDEEVLAIDRFDITPNPVHGTAVIAFSNDNNQAYDLTLTSVTGQTVRQISGITNDRIELDATSLAAGMYFATLRNADGATVTRRMIVE
jgi:hypothetical protein